MELTPRAELQDARRKRTPSGVPYKHEPYRATHWRWYDGIVYEINDTQKEFVVSRISAKGGPFLTQFNTADWQTPFLPGLPHDISLKQWKFIVSRQTSDHVFLRATPRPGNPFARTTGMCELILKLAPIRLVGTRSISPAGASSICLAFSDVQVNPPVSPEPSLSDYKAVSSIGKR